MERRYVYRRYFGLMLLFGFPQDTQLDKISPTVLVILIISMASPSRDAFLCLCVPVLSASFPRSLQQGPKGAQRIFPKFSAKIQQIFEIYKDFSNKMQFYLYFVLQSQINRSFGRFFYFYLHISQKSSTFARKIVERCRGFRIKLIL